MLYLLFILTLSVAYSYSLFITLITGAFIFIFGLLVASKKSSKLLRFDVKQISDRLRLRNSLLNVQSHLKICVVITQVI